MGEPEYGVSTCQNVLIRRSDIPQRLSRLIKEALESDEEQKRDGAVRRRRRRSLEEQCGSITFENMFEYSHANLENIIIRRGLEDCRGQG